MDFRDRKLPTDAAPNLKEILIDTVKPFTLMMAPVYVLMKLNAKYVSVKAPLDFFTPEELERYRKFETFFFPEFIEQLEPFREAGVRVRELLSWRPEEGRKSESGSAMIQIPAPSFELSDRVLRLLGPLWATGTVIEPFFAAALVDELCQRLPADLLRQCRDRDIERYETGIFLSSWAVFLGLHLGYCSLPFLDILRLRVFSEITGQTAPRLAVPEVDELLKIARESLRGRETRAFTGDFFLSQKGRAARKLLARLERVKAQLIVASEGDGVPTIYGERGFADA